MNSSSQCPVQSLPLPHAAKDLSLSHYFLMTRFISFAQTFQLTSPGDSQRDLAQLRQQLEDYGLKCSQLQSSLRRQEEELAVREREIVQLQQRLEVAEEGQAACKRRMEATERFKEEEVRSVRETSQRIKEEEVKAARQLAADSIDQLKVCMCLQKVWKQGRDEKIQEDHPTSTCILHDYYSENVACIRC